MADRSRAFIARVSASTPGGEGREQHRV